MDHEKTMVNWKELGVRTITGLPLGVGWLLIFWWNIDFYPLWMFIPLIVLGIFTGIWLHELSHYVLYRSFGGKPRIIREYFILTRSVEFDSENLSRTAIRWGGGITIVYPILLYSYLFIGSFPTPILDIAVMHVIVFASGFSTSDCLALFFPSLFREYDKGGEYSHSEALKYLKRGFRERFLDEN